MQVLKNVDCLYMDVKLLLYIHGHRHVPSPPNSQTCFPHSSLSFDQNWHPLLGCEPIKQLLVHLQFFPKLHSAFQSFPRLVLHSSLFQDCFVQCSLCNCDLVLKITKKLLLWPICKNCSFSKLLLGPLAGHRSCLIANLLQFFGLFFGCFDGLSSLIQQLFHGSTSLALLLSRQGLFELLQNFSSQACCPSGGGCAATGCGWNHYDQSGRNFASF